MCKPISPTAFDPEEAVKYLCKDFPVRRVSEVLQWAVREKAEERKTTGVVTEADLQAVDTEFKKMFCPKNKPKNETLLRIWREDKVKRVKRGHAIEIAFALRMNYAQANKLLERFWHNGLYMRDMKDVIYRYGLEHGWSYDKALKTISDSALYQDMDNQGNPALDEDSKNLTQDLDNEYENFVKSEADLKEFIKQNKHLLGSFRRKAYLRFKELYDETKSKMDEGVAGDYEEKKKDGEARYKRKKATMAEICEEIVKGIPEMKKRGVKNTVFRLISEFLPTRREMSQIFNQYEVNGIVSQVDRKLLILTWLASEDGTIDEGQEYNAFIGMIDNLLESCGMPVINYNHPFDWMLVNTIYCVYHDKDEDTDINDIKERLKNFIDRLKDTGNPDDEESEENMEDE